MELKALIAIGKAALVLGAVILLDDMIRDILPPFVVALLPIWCWILPTEAALRPLERISDT